MSTAAQKESDTYDDEEEHSRMMGLFMKEESEKPPGSYQLYLMDEQAMSDLKRRLEKSQARLASDGFLREFIPRKPSTSNGSSGSRPHLNGDSARRISSAPISLKASTSPAGLDAQPETSSQKLDVNMTPRSATASSQAQRKMKYDTVLRREIHIIRDLEDHYDTVKQALLRHMEQLCTMKVNERPLQDDAYDGLEEMVQFLDSTDNQKT